MNKHNLLHAIKTVLGLVAMSFAFATPNFATAAPTTDASAARVAAKDAYIFTYPLVMNYRTMYSQAIKGDRAFGKWLHLGLASPADTDIVTPNNDTPYSYVWLDLRAEPWVLTMPKIEKDRFYTSQWDDLWGYVLDNAGSVEDGNDGVAVMLASPSWKGELPKGIKRIIQGESDILGSLTRTQILNDKNDTERMKEIRQSYKLEPLSKFLGKEAPPSAPTINWPTWTEGDETKLDYWNYVAFLLPFVTPNPDDKQMYEKLAAIGIVRGKSFDSSKLDPEMKKALQTGIDDARAEFKKLQSDPSYDTAKLFGPREKIGTDYIDRAMGVYLGIFGNVPSVSKYYSIPTDAAGQAFDGSNHAYTLTFPKDQIPPVRYFWSVTMYKLPQRWLVENPSDRYSIGSSTPGLKTGEDGQITLYISAESPGEDKKSNWLPAPKAPFWMVLRTYGPGKSILDNTYKVPPVKPGSD